jgi:hypothetical protein
MRSFNSKVENEKNVGNVHLDDSLFEDEISLFNENMKNILKAMDETVQTYYLRGLILEKEVVKKNI